MEPVDYEPTFWERLISVQLSLIIQPFHWGLKAGADDMSTYVELGPFNVSLWYWG